MFIGQQVRNGFFVIINDAALLCLVLAMAVFLVTKKILFCTYICPFSKAFNFIGSGIMYSLTVLILIASLMVKRPWCNLFCPVKSMFFYFRFILLCGAEIGPGFLSRAQKEGGAVLYVRSVEKDLSKRKIVSKHTDYRTLVEYIDPNGA